ncbi:DUF2779 domain-containing protein [Patescibacteria group bacterium]|nr:DUF2779 domain-containing protein [Patescibacteria group bacterium]MBU1075140.1 DUF2779 domain-containing protein [Patescibacteria group bacterium]MBU1951758.1 DUF2779 domain-containing protein [Patescibacteria group bacterium]
MLLTKTNYLVFKECPQNAWVKIFRPEIYQSKQISDFDKMIMESGNQIDELARELFPGGILIEDRKDIHTTKKLVDKKEKIIYQPVFYTDKFEAIADMLVWNDNKNAYDIYEVKSTNSGKNKSKHIDEYKHDLAFQVNVLKELAVPINNTYIIRLNSEYVRQEKLDIKELLIIEDFTDEVMGIVDIVLDEMNSAYDSLKLENKPQGYCSCIRKGRSAHCISFDYLNPEIPEYSVHDIARIGNSKKKLSELIDRKIYSIFDVPSGFELSDIQRNQVDVAHSKKIIIDKEKLANFFSDIEYPISFLDYETFPSAIPRFVGYSPYNQIPFQFSLHILQSQDSELEHFEFLYIDKNNPDLAFINELKKYLPENGSIIVWNKTFESGINEKLSKRHEEHLSYMENVNSRIVDLEVPFTSQFYIHPEFSGKTSIKKILPALAPEFSHKVLNIQEGGTASDTWNKIVSGEFDEKGIKEKSKDLLEYCKLDTLAMFEIWKHCMKQLED